VTFPELVQEVTDALVSTGLSPDSLILEVTESLLLHDSETAGRTLDALRRCGVRIALDDFGSGHAGMANLRHLPLDVLKIDRSLITDTTDRRGRALLRAVVDMGHALDLEVLAEGIETADELARARAAECDAVQGYLIGRPMSYASLCKFLGLPGKPSTQKPGRGQQKNGRKAPACPGQPYRGLDVGGC
jgi:EAL domain-containing protein (putative c-di-GMP-specific phosphodiesterase class I)